MTYHRAAKLQRQVPAQLLLAESLPSRALGLIGVDAVRLASGGISDPGQLGEGGHLGQGALCKPLRLPQVGSPTAALITIGTNKLNGTPSGGNKGT